MALKDCFGLMRTAAGDEKIRDDELMNILDELQRRKEEAGDAGFTKSAEQMAAEQEAVAAIKKRQALGNLQKRVIEAQRIEAGGPKNIVDSFRAELHGINTPTERSGSRFSTQAEQNALHRDYIEGSTRELQRAGLFNIAKRGLLDKEVAQELAELTKGEEGKPGISGSKEAQGIAQIWNRYLTLAKTNANKAGAWIGDYFGYVSHTSHDPTKISQGGLGFWGSLGKSYEEKRANWIRDTLPLLDADKTFAGVKEPLTFMQHVYDNFITGVHMTAEGAQGFKEPAFTGPGNLAKSLSEGRILHWKDAESWLTYQKKYGQGNLSGAVMGSMRSLARDTALMRRWGTNPRAEFQATIQRFREKYNHSDPQAVASLNKWQGALQNRFDQLDGTANRSENRLWSRVGSMVRLDESMSKLGGVLLTHLSAGMTRASELRHHGVGFLESYKNYFESIVQGSGRGQMKGVYDELGAGADMATRDLESRFEPGDDIPGTLSSIAGTYFKWTGLSYAYNAWRGGTEAMLSHNLGRQLDAAFGELKPETQAMLHAYGIDQAHWDMLRQAPDHISANSRTYLTPKAAMRVPDNAIEAHLNGQGLPAAARNVEDFRQDLANRLNAYFVDSSGRAMIMPGAEERAILYQGTRPGTPVGEAVRFLSQFKLWPTTLMTQGIGRELFTSRNAASSAVGITHMIAMGMVFGYIRMAANDLANGKNVRDPLSVKTMLAALMQGGGMGIAGDFLFGQYSRFGASPLITAMGPVASDVNTIYDLFNKAKEYAVTGGQKGEKMAPEAFNFALQHIPFANLFYLRSALNYLLFYRIQEAMSPGYLNRMQARIKSENAQSFWISPAAFVKQGVVQPSQ